MRGSESSGLNSSQSLVLCGREKGRNSKEMFHSGYKGSEEGYTDVPHQLPSTVLESSNLVCKSKEIKCNPDSWVLCLQTLHSLSVSAWSSRDLRTSYEDGDGAHGHNCSWAWDSNTCKNKWLWVWLSWLRACLVCLSKLWVQSQACPACAYIQRSTSTYLRAIQVRYPTRDRHPSLITFLLCTDYTWRLQKNERSLSE